MNLSSNHEPCSTHPFYPCLRQEESCLTHGWSRDLSWEPNDETAFQSLCFNEATNIGGGTNSFGSAWDFIPNCSTDDTYNGYGLGPENLSLTGFEVRHNSEPENYEYWGEEECHLYVTYY
jgi:hypothetical protein